MLKRVCRPEARFLYRPCSSTSLFILHELMLVLTLTSDKSVYGRLEYAIFSLMKLTRHAPRSLLGVPSCSLGIFRDFTKYQFLLPHFLSFIVIIDVYCTSISQNYEYELFQNRFMIRMTLSILEYYHSCLIFFSEIMRTCVSKIII